MDNLNNRFVPVRERIFTLLTSKHISQKDFAKEIGIHVAVISDWKKGRNFSFIKKLNSIAYALDTSVVWLLTGKNTTQDQEAIREMEAIAKEWNIHLLDLLGIWGKDGKAAGPIKIGLKQSRLDALDIHLRALVSRYEAEAAAFASLGEPGRGYAEARLRAAEEARALWDFFLDV